MAQKTQTSNPSRRVKSVWLVGFAVLLFGTVRGILAFATRAVPEDIISLSGRIEGDDSVIAPKTSGRILEVRFREGDRVTAGEVIALLDDEQVRAREQQARAALTKNEALSDHLLHNYGYVTGLIAKHNLLRDLDPYLTEDVLARIQVDKKRIGGNLRFLVIREVGVCEAAEIAITELRTILRPVPGA